MLIHKNLDEVLEAASTDARLGASAQALRTCCVMLDALEPSHALYQVKLKRVKYGDRSSLHERLSIVLATLDYFFEDPPFDVDDLSVVALRKAMRDLACQLNDY